MLKKSLKALQKNAESFFKKSLLQIVLKCSKIQNADARLGERCEAARCKEGEAWFCCFFDAYIF